MLAQRCEGANGSEVVLEAGTLEFIFWNVVSVLVITTSKI